MSRGRVLFGMVLVVLGTVIWLDRVEGANEAHAALRFFGTWWPVALVALGVAFLAAYLRDRWWLWGPLLVMATGLAALGLTVLGTPARASDFLLPATLVGLGVLTGLTAPPAPDDQHPRYIAILRGRRLAATASEIRRGGAVAFLGHLVLDLTRGAGLYDKRGEMDVTAILGSVELRVPASWEISQRRSVEFPPEPGSSRKPATDTAVHEGLGAPRLTLHTTTVFGAVQVTPVQAPKVTPVE